MEHFEQVIEIREVIDRYATGIDQRDWELVASCFTEDCSSDYGRSGSWETREALIAWLEETHREVRATLHRLTNHRIAVNGEEATATSYFDALLRVEHRGHDLLQVVGTYTDRLRLTGDGWKISARTTENFLWRRSGGEG
jgi:ketosteroid isomerase-like protein